MSTKKDTPPIKPTKGSSLTHEKSENSEFRLSQLEKKVKEMDGSMLKKVDILGSHENPKIEWKKKKIIGYKIRVQTILPKINEEGKIILKP